MHALVSMNNAHPTIIRDSLPCHGVSSYGKILLRLDIEHQHLVETIENVVFLPNRHFSLNFMLQSYPTSDHGDHVEH